MENHPIQIQPLNPAKVAGSSRKMDESPLKSRKKPEKRLKSSLQQRAFLIRSH
jgi:hypothetical protein